MVPTGFNEDEMPRGYIPSKNEESSESEDTAPEEETTFDFSQNSVVVV